MSVAPAEAIVSGSFVLTGEESALIEQLLTDLEREYGDPEGERFLRDATIVAHDLPRRLRSHVNEQRLSDHGDVITVLGLPIDQAAVGPTPAHWRDRGNRARVSREEFYIVLVASLLGDVFGWATQQDGHLVNDVLPIRGHEEEQLGSASAVELSWHTEDAFHPYRADYLGLLGLRNPQNVGTTLCLLRDVARVNGFPDILWEPRFFIQPDNSHLPTNNSSEVTDHLADQFDRILEMVEHPRPTPLLFGSRVAPCWSLDPDFVDVEVGDGEARQALDELFDSVSRLLFDVVLGPGDLIFIDNHRVVHGRRRFAARYDGNDRWLKRVNVTRDLRKSEDMRSSGAVRAIGA